MRIIGTQHKLKIQNNTLNKAVQSGRDFRSHSDYMRHFHYSLLILYSLLFICANHIMI